MKLPRLLQTTAVRLAAKYTLLYALLLGAALLALAWSTDRVIDTQLEDKLQQEMTALREAYASGGIDKLVTAMARHEQDTLEEGRFHLLVARNGKKLSGNLLAWPEAVSVSDDDAVQTVLLEEEIIPHGIVADDVYWPVIAQVLPDGNRLLLTRDVEQASELQEIADYLSEFSIAALLLAMAIGVTIGRVILKRMDTISRTAAEIMTGDLSRRVPVSGKHDEFDILAEHLNQMLDRIQQLIKGIRQTTDNVAHDLRSPLTRLRNRFEVTLLEPRSETEYRHAISRGVEDMESLIKTFNALLEIAQAEAGNHRVQWEPVQLDQLATDLLDLYRPVAEEKNQSLEFAECVPTRITGSRNLLAQTISNLLENAMKYTPEGGRISVRLIRATDSIDLSIADTGPGIPSSERQHVLERFVRLDSARHTPGNGLGLSLVRAVAGLHNARLELGDAAPGLVVTLHFPKAALSTG